MGFEKFNPINQVNLNKEESNLLEEDLVTEELTDEIIEEETEFEEYDPNVRKKIKIDTDLSVNEIQEKYHVSRATAYRVLGRGWLVINEKKRLIICDNKWVEDNAKEIEEMSKVSAKHFLRKHSLQAIDLSPFDLEDLISEAKKRIIELSGHEHRDKRSFMITAGVNAVSDFMRYKVRFYSDKKERTVHDFDKLIN